MLVLVMPSVLVVLKMAFVSICHRKLMPGYGRNSRFAIRRGCEIPSTATRAVAEGDVLGLVVSREESADGVRIPSKLTSWLLVCDVRKPMGGLTAPCFVSRGQEITASISMRQNGEELGVRVTGVRFCMTRQWFFAVSGESEAIALVRLAI